MGITDADHAEEHPEAPTLLLVPVSCPVPGRMSGAPKLSGHLTIQIRPGSRAAAVFGRAAIEEEYCCNYEMNGAYHDAIDAAGLRIVGLGSAGEARIVELPDHPFYIATLFQPQRASRPEAPHPLVTAFLTAAAS